MKTTRYTLADAEALARSDKRRMLILGAGAVLIGAAYFLAEGERRSAADSLHDDVGRIERDDAEPVSVPPLPFEDEAALAKIHDATEAERMLIDAEALVSVFRHARNQTATHLAGLGIRDLDATIAAQIAAKPAEHRLAALRVRGEVVDVERRRREGGLRDDWLVTLRGEGGLVSHALFAFAPHGDEGADAVRVGDHLRVDGLFFKVFRQEVGGAWLEGPLVLGHRAIESMAPIDDKLARGAPALESLTDDDVGAVTGIDPAAKWQLMARAKRLADETDWSSVQEIDTATLTRIFEDGEAYRGTPFRFPLSRNLQGWTTAAEENPLGLARVSEGWIGNVMWRPPVAVVKWVAPFEWDHLLEWDEPDGARFIEARGWFLKNIVYDKKSGEPGRVPLFVMAAVDVVHPEPDPLADWFLYGVGALTLIVVSSIFFLLRSDKRRSEKLYEDLVRRRRARRERASLEGAPQA